MFIFDFVAETILDQILDWIYGKIIGFLNDFFVMMNNMGVELILSILVYTFFTRMFDFMLPLVVKYSIVAA